MIIISTPVRKNKQQAEMRAAIIQSARVLLAHNGIEHLSIRKVAQQIDYSPAIVYHYFNNKEEIIDALLEEDYEKIVEAVKTTAEYHSKKDFKNGIVAYIRLVTDMGAFYKNVMISDSPRILQRTSVLHKGAAQERPALEALCSDLRVCPAFANQSDADIELAAQIIWSTLFGLATRIIIEDVDKDQKERLAEQAAELILKMIR